MPQWVIKSISNQKICTVKSVEKHGQLMNGRWLTVDIDSAVKLALSAGCYIEFEGIRYSIRSFADVEKSARQLSHGGAFSYKGLRLDDVSWQALEDTQMCDYVYGDNHLHYSGLGTFSFFASKASDVGYRVLANLRNKYGSSWDVLIDGGSLARNDYVDYTFDEGKLISISSGTSVKEALDLLWSNWGVYYKVGYRTIDIITSDREPGIELKYGKDEGLKSIRRKINPNVEICTRVRAYGSERNMPYRWYNKKYTNPPIFGDAMNVPQLMLPHYAYIKSQNEIEFIDANGDLYDDTPPHYPYNLWATPNDIVLPSNNGIIEKYGSRDKEIHWNSDDMGEIFPSMKGMMSNDVPSLRDIYHTNIHLDQLLSTAVNEDTTPITGTGETSELTTGKINFVVRVPNPGFDPMAQKGQEDVVLLMQSGMCQSRGFVILKSEAVIDNEQIVAYDLTCVKTVDDEIDQVFPNGNYTINGGEEYVYTGLTFNDESSLDSSWLAVYIGAAEKRLLRAAAIWLREHQTEQYVYEITPDNIYLQRQKDENENFDITEGDFITLSQDDLGHSEEVVETVVVRYGKEAIPTYEISFLRRDESESLGDRVKGLVGQTISVDSDIAKMNDAMYKKVNKSGFHTLFDPLDAQYNVLDINGDLTNLKYIRANVDFFSIKGVAALGTVSGGGGGGGGADLNALLASINDSSIGDTAPAAAQLNKCLVWTSNGWSWGTTGGGGGGGITTVNVSSPGLLTGGSVSGTTLTLNTRAIQATDIPSLPYVQRARGVEMYTSDSINYVSARLLNASGSYDDVRQRKASYGNGTHNGYIEWYAGDSYGYMNHAMGHLILTDSSNQIWADTSGSKKFSLPSTSGTLALVSQIPTSMPWSAITNTPDTIQGYGITDAKIATTNNVTSITLGNNTLTPVTKTTYNYSDTANYVLTSGSISGNTLTLGRRTLASILNSSGYTWWGQTMSSSGVVSGNMSSVGNITMSGSIYMNVGKNIQFDSKNTLEVDNYSVALGYGYRTTKPLGLYGNVINFYPNDGATQPVANVSAGGVVVGTSTTDITHYIQIGGARLYWDENANSLYVQKYNGAPCNFYSLGGIAALGATSSGTTDVDVSKLTITSPTDGIVFKDSTHGDAHLKLNENGYFTLDKYLVMSSDKQINIGSAALMQGHFVIDSYVKFMTGTYNNKPALFLMMKETPGDSWHEKYRWTWGNGFSAV